MYRETSCGVILFKEENGIEYVLVRDINGNFTFPKGQLQRGETTKECAVRAVKEKVDLDVKLIDGIEKRISYILPDGTLKEVIFYVANIDGLSPYINDFGTTFIYVDDYIEAMNHLSFDNLKDLLQTVDNIVRSELACNPSIKDKKTNREISSVISKPKNKIVTLVLGEKTYEIKEFHYSIFDWLEKVCKGLEEREDFNISCCNDDQIINCTVTQYATYIYADNSNKVEKIQITNFAFARLLLKDIKNNIEEYITVEDNGLIENKEYLTLRIQRLKLLIEKAYCLCYGKERTESYKRLCNHIERINKKIIRLDNYLYELQTINLFEKLVCENYM